jgi:flavin reductase (DIM6/NTAB) family NADH-FMN oxidoreductase RutF
MMADGSMHMTQMRAFAPGPASHRAFRDALGRFATGVTIVTARTPDGLIGMTANSFASVSMDPPLVMWCPAKSSHRYGPFVDARHFAIHVMGADHEAQAMAFARSGQAFDGLDMELNDHGVPLLNACLARFECAMHQVHDAGDHAIVVGRVTGAAVREGSTLVFCQGQFGTFDKGA